MVKYHIPLIVISAIKNQKFNFPVELCDIRKNVKNKIVGLKKIFQFCIGHFLIE